MYYQNRLTKTQKQNVINFIRKKSEEVYNFSKELYPNLHSNLKVICRNHPEDISRGGINKHDKPFISISYGFYLKQDPTSVRPFDTDPEIGKFKYKSFKKRITSIICHEIAHAVQYQIVHGPENRYIDIPHARYYSNYEFEDPNNHKYYQRGENDKYDVEVMFGHGSLWQSIYRTLRNEFVNNKKYNDRDLGFKSGRNTRDQTKNSILSEDLL